MDLQKIKERLATLRPEDLDPGDPEIGELLMLVEEDFELGEWFAREQVFDQAFADKLQEIQPPEGLDQRIIAAMAKAKTTAADSPPVPQASGVKPEAEIETATPAPRREAEAQPEIGPAAAPMRSPGESAVRAEQPVEMTPVVTEDPTEGEQQGTAIPFKPTPKRPWWQQPGILSAAATLVLVLAVVAVMFDGPTLSAEEVDDFYQTIGGHHVSNGALALESDSLEEIRDYLQRKGAPVPGQLPANIDPYPELGCSTLHFKGELVSVIHMHDQENVHIYVVRHELFPELNKGPQPRLVELNQVVVLGWSDGAVHYFLVRTGDLAEIDSLL